MFTVLISVLNSPIFWFFGLVGLLTIAGLLVVVVVGGSRKPDPIVDECEWCGPGLCYSTCNTDRAQRQRREAKYHGDDGWGR